MARLWIEDEEELLMDCMNRRMTVRETFNEFEYCGFDRTLKSIEYKRSKINKTWAYDHDTGKAMSEKTKVTYPRLRIGLNKKSLSLIGYF